jgi:hypothetical protein
VPFGITFGCDVGDCFSGTVAFESFGTTVDFGTRLAAQQSFVFTEVPAPSREGLRVATLATIAMIHFRRRQNSVAARYREASPPDRAKLTHETLPGRLGN